MKIDKEKLKKILETYKSNDDNTINIIKYFDKINLII